MKVNRDTRTVIWSVAVPGILLLLFSGALAACNPVSEYQAVYTGDMEPPRFGGVEPVSAGEVRFRFDEPVEPADGSLLLDGEPLGDAAFTSEGAIATLRPALPLAPGRKYHLQGVFRDEAGNSTSVATAFYGPNPDLPAMLINEFNPEGSKNNPDMVELRVLEAGNIGGVVIYEGSPSDWESRFVLPAVEVAEGSFVLIHYKPEGTPEEVDETADPAASGGVNVHDEAWDFWVPDGDGYTNTNGSLVLSEYPGGPIIDAVIFSTKRYDPEDAKRGFGRSAILLRNEEIVQAKEWTIQGEVIIPEDAVDPEDSSATRSINRTPGAGDSDGASDWHIVPSGGATFGYENSLERYEG